MKPIKQSALSYSLAAVSTSILIFLTTFGGTFFIPAVIGLALILTGIVFTMAFKLHKQETAGEDFVEEDAPELGLVAVFGLIALMAFVVYNWLIPVLQFAPGSVTVTTFFSTYQLPLTTQGDLMGAAVFTIFLIPNAEEQFFRGFWGNLAASYLPPGLSELVAGGIFMVFHTAVYSLFLPLNIDYILILTAAGFTFVAVDIYTQDIATSVLAHTGNNALSFLLGGSVITVLFPGVAIPQGLSILAPAMVPALLVGFMVYRSRRQLPIDWNRVGAFAAAA
jgi:membrane protease YdiL (CAAX protease family)